MFRGNNNTPSATSPIAGLTGAKSSGNTPMNPSLQQRINFLQSHLSQAPMPSIATKYLKIIQSIFLFVYIINILINNNFFFQ